MPTTRPRFTAAYLLHRLNTGASNSGQLIRAANDRQAHLARVTDAAGR